MQRADCNAFVVPHGLLLGSPRAGRAVQVIRAYPMGVKSFRMSRAEVKSGRVILESSPESATPRGKGRTHSRALLETQCDMLWHSTNSSSYTTTRQAL